MLAEIRRAQIVVADFTGHKNGVYFEAGFTMALKKELYWTCKKEAMTAAHFDTNHYQHIVWSDYLELRRRLSEKIVAVSGQGPHSPPKP